MDADLMKAGIGRSREFYDSYHTDKTDLKQQAANLFKLADLYSRRAEEKCQWLPGVTSPQPNWTNYIRAHTLYNSTAVRDRSLENECTSAAIDLEMRYFTHECSLSPEQHKSYFHGGERSLLIANCEKVLKRLRCKLSSEVVQLKEVSGTWNLEKPILKQSIPHQEFVEGVKSIRETCTNEMVSLIADIVDKICIMLGGIACCFEVVCFGSLARWEMTPYSDLEFMFLYEHGSPDSEVVKLKHLALSMYFVISSMRETNLRYMNIPELGIVVDEDNTVHKKAWFTDSMKNGFKIDGLGDNAGNIPTGNGQLGSKDLITTPEKLYSLWLSELTNPQNEVIVGGFSDLLCASIVVYRNSKESSLMDTFFSLLPSDISELQPNYFPMKLDILKKDLEKFYFMPGAQDGGDFKHDVKKDIYRFPSIALYDIKVLLQINSVQADDTIKYLEKAGVTEQCAFAMTMLVSLAYYIRLTAYLTVNSQKDDVLSLLPALSPSEADQDTYHCPANIYATFGLIHIPFRQYLKMSLNKGLKSREEFLVMMERLEINCHSSFTRALVYFYSKSWQKCFSAFDEVVSGRGMDILKPGDLYSCLVSIYDENSAWIGELMMIDVLLELEYHEPAVRYAQDAVKKLTAVDGYQAATFLEVQLWARIGIAFHHQGRYQDTSTYIEKALKSLLEVECYIETDEKKKLTITSECYLNWGNALARSNKIEQAVEKYQLSLSVCKGNGLKLGTLQCHNSMAALWIAERNYSEAENHASKALELCKEQYGQNSVHPETANALQNLATALSQTKSSFDDIVMVTNTFEMALDMHNKLPAAEAKPLRTSNLACQAAYGNFLINCRRIDEAKIILQRVYKECLDHQIDNHITVFTMYSLGKAYTASGEIDNAVKILQDGIGCTTPGQSVHLLMQGGLLEGLVKKSDWSSAKQIYDSIVQSLSCVKASDKPMMGASMAVFLLPGNTPRNLIEPEQLELAIQLLQSSTNISHDFQKKAISLQLKLGRIFWEAGSYDRAQSLASQARQTSDSLNLPTLMAEALVILALCASAVGDSMTSEQCKAEAFQLIAKNTNINVDLYR